MAAPTAAMQMPLGLPPHHHHHQQLAAAATAAARQQGSGPLTAAGAAMSTQVSAGQQPMASSAPALPLLADGLPLPAAAAAAAPTNLLQEPQCIDPQCLRALAERDGSPTAAMPSQAAADSLGKAGDLAGQPMSQPVSRGPLQAGTVMISKTSVLTQRLQRPG